MEDLDDDFGDIYADVEAQASSAVNAVSTFSHFEADQEEEEDHDQINGGDKPSCVANELGAEASQEYSESDSEDDLNIVLNDDEGCNGMRVDDCDDEGDDEALVAANDSKYVWTEGSAYTSCGKATASVDVMPLGGDQWQNNRGRDAPNTVVTRNRYGFRLPWYRTILDVDVESFDEKSWRYPGVDVTDYFNFDLNEDSWKEYCKSVQQLRHVKSTQYGMPGSSKCYQDAISTEFNNTGSWTYAHPSSIISDCRPIGKAIQIEDSIVERQPSFDSRHPRSWDSDVVIQISVQERTQETANSSAEQAHTVANKKSENGQIDAHGNQDDISYNTTNDEDSSSGSPEANLRTLDGCSKKINLSHQMTIDCDGHRNNQIIDVDGNYHKEVNDSSLEAMELANKVTEIPDGNTSSADQCMMDTQLLLSDDELSLISSCFESDSEASRNSAPSDREDIHTPVIPLVNSRADNYGTPFTNSEGNCVKRRRVDVQDHFICRSSSLKKHNHQGGRHTSIDGPNYHRNNDNDVSPTSDTEDPTDWNFKEYSRGQKERLHGDGGRNRTYISDYKEPKMSCHYGIRDADIHDHNRREERKYSSPRSSHQLQPKLDPYANRSFDERRISSEDTDSDWNHFGVTRFTEEKSPLRRRESRGLHVRSSYAVGERDAQWRRNNNELLFKKIPAYRWHEDDFLGEKSGRCPSYTSRQRFNFDEFEERKLPPIKRQMNNWGRRGEHVGSPMYLNDSLSENFEDVHFAKENLDVRCQSYRDLYEADDGYWNHPRSPRNDVLYPRTDERYRRDVRMRDVEEYNEGNWFADHCDGYGFEDDMRDNNHLRWRRSNWGSEVMLWTEDQFNVRHHGDEVYSEKASCSYQKYVRRENFHVKYGSLSHEMQIDYMQPGKHRLILPRKEIGANFATRSVKMGRGKHEQLVRSRNSTDLAVREQKIPARVSKARNSMSNGNGGPANMGIKWNQNKKRHDSFPGTARAPNADLDIEEGQIVAEKQNTTHTLQMKHSSDYTEPTSSLKTKVVEAYDEQKILQTMAKMEQRGKRFKEPVSFKMEPDILFTPEVDPTVETADETSHRPARKRRWGGRFSKNDSLMLGIPLKTRI